MLNQVADGVWVRQSAWVWSNAIVVRADDGLILVDPGIDGSDLNQLADDLGRLGMPVVAGFSTHPHWDHLLWHHRFGDVPRFATPAGADAASQARERAQAMAAESASGIPLEPVYGPGDRGTEPPPPGAYPFTRGNFASGYRGKLWTLRQYSGFGTVEESNRRYRYLLEQGGTGLSVALDLPTQCGYDSDHPDVEEEVGRVGVALDTLADAEILFDQIPLDRISTSFTINGTAAILLAFYVAVGERLPCSAMSGSSPCARPWPRPPSYSSSPPSISCASSWCSRSGRAPGAIC